MYLHSFYLLLRDCASLYCDFILASLFSVFLAFKNAFQWQAYVVIVSTLFSIFACNDRMFDLIQLIFATCVVCDCTARTPRTDARCVTLDPVMRGTTGTTSVTADNQHTTEQNIPAVSTRTNATSSCHLLSDEAIKLHSRICCVSQIA